LKHSPGGALPFRRDIEGLRAIAILLVVCAHAGVPWLAGGFIGVDVFFVLSGYLITGRLLRELQANGRIGFTAFYARRLQRLFPGLLLVIACTAGAAMVLLAPFEQVPQARAAAAAGTWTSNFLFALHRLDYFGPAADTNLFLHTWSLGVEEQFYLLWPAWMLFLLGAFAWQRRDRNHRHLAWGMAATSIACLALSVVLTYAQPQLGFYMVFSRGWQFALGALAFLCFDGRARLHGEGLAAWVGFAAIFVAALVLDDHTPYPGFCALLPSLGTAALLVGGRTPGEGFVPARLLATPPLQGIGRVSYAWYLWHWPVLLLGASLVPVADGWQRAGLAAIAFVLAVISHALVEAPVRRAAWLRARPRIVLAVGVLTMAGIVLASAAWRDKAEEWSGSPGQLRYTKVRNDAPAIYAMGCDEWYHSSRVRVCGFGPATAPHTAVLIGDSVAGQWFPAVWRHFDKPGWRLFVITKSSCPMVDQPIFYARIGREYTECEQWRNDALGAMPSLHPDVVLFSSVPTYDFSPQEWEAGTSRVLDALARSGARIGVLAPTPLLPFDGPACLARRDWRRQWFPATDACTATAHGSTATVGAALAAAVDRHPQARLLDLDGVVCPDGTCRAEWDGIIVYRDHQHVTATFVETLSRPLGEALRESGIDPVPIRGDEK
jgi:peptidoglycan/LPS O-acetylase OafA/YrhL